MSESASGEASSSNDSAANESFPCPSCESAFDSKNGRNVHHYQKHGESLAWGEYECYTCGETFERRKCEVDGVEKPTCSMECRSKVLSEAHTGERNHKYKPSTVECSACGSEIEVQPVKLDTQDNYFCDQSCMGEWLSENNCGPDHHQYIEDKKNKRLYNTVAWERTRSKAIERDGGECQACGTDKDLTVHHITPVNSGGEMFDLSNLVTLCRSCHMKWEGLNMRPDTQ